MEAPGVTALAASTGSRRLWPYNAAAGFLAVGAIGFLYAPFAGVVYVALPGVALATYTAFVRRDAPRVGWAVSSVAFVLGFVIGASGLALAATGAVSGSFLAEESGFLLVAAALWLLPLFGLVIGGASLARTYVRRDG